MATQQQLAYIQQRATQMGLDPKAVMAIAGHEGLSGGIGDGGHAFGPFQLNNAGGVITGQFQGQSAQQINQWAWSPQGIDYALGHMATVAKGLTGQSAVEAIARRFERPANPGAEIADAMNHYGGGASAGAPGGGSPYTAGPSTARPPSGLAASMVAPPEQGQHVVTSKLPILGQSLAAEMLSQASALQSGGTPDLKNMFTLAKGFMSARRGMGNVRPAPLGGTALAQGVGLTAQPYQAQISGLK